MESELKGFRQYYGDSAEFVCLQGTYESKEEGSDFMLKAGWKPPFYEWTIRGEFSLDPQTGEKLTPFPDIVNGVELTMENLAKELKENGPYDSIIGFSQGSIITRYFHRIVYEIDKESFPDRDSWFPKHLIFVGGVYSPLMKFRYKGTVYDQTAFRHNIASLHIIGDTD